MKRIITFILSFMLVFVFVSNITAKADTGPKPDTTITIINLPKSDYVCAYLVNREWFAHDTYERLVYNNEEFYFGNYEDLKTIYDNVEMPEGWYLSDISYRCNDATEMTLDSGYMWPSTFRLVIYDVVNDKTYITTKTETYAFHSYFKLDLSNTLDYSLSREELDLKNNYNYGKEILWFFIRLALTLGIELLIALAFSFTKKSFIYIVLANVTTQIILNVILNIESFNNGKSLILIPMYIIIELIIMILEGIFYFFMCRKKNSSKRFYGIIYAIVANIASFLIGAVLWYYI